MDEFRSAGFCEAGLLRTMQNARTENPHVLAVEVRQISPPIKRPAMIVCKTTSDHCFKSSIMNNPKPCIIASLQDL
jgi:hypothetical protein